MKSFVAFLMLLGVVALICSPLYIVWLGLVGDFSLTGKIIMLVVGIITCLLVKPISIITGKEDFPI